MFFNKNNILRAVLFFILFFIIGYKIDIKLIREYFTFELLIAFFIIQPIVLGSLFFSALRFFLLSNNDDYKNIACIFKGVLLTIGVNVIVPGRIAETIKPIYLKKVIKLPLEIGFAALFLEKIIDMFILAILSIVSITMIGEINIKYLIVMLVISLLIFVCIIFYEARLLCFLDKNLNNVKIKENLKKLILHISNSTKNSSLYKAFVLGLLIWITAYIEVIVFLAYASNKSFSLMNSLLVYIFLIFGGAVSVVPGGFGTYEAATAYAMSFNNIKLEEAIPLAVTLHLAQIFIPAVATVIILLTEKFSWVNILKTDKEKEFL